MGLTSEDENLQSLLILVRYSNNLTMLQKKPHCEQLSEQSKRREWPSLRWETLRILSKYHWPEMNRHKILKVYYTSMPSSFNSHTRWQSKVFFLMWSGIDTTRNKGKQAAANCITWHFPFLKLLCINQWLHSVLIFSILANIPTYQNYSYIFEWA